MIFDILVQIVISLYHSLCICLYGIELSAKLIKLMFWSSGKITLRDLKDSRMATNFFNMCFNFEKYWEFEQDASSKVTMDILIIEKQV